MSSERGAFKLIRERDEWRKRANKAEQELERIRTEHSCDGEPISAGGLPVDGVIYPGDPAHCEACREAAERQSK